MNKRKLILVCIAALLVLALAVPAASAYFTTYVRVPGSKTLHLSDSTEFTETQTEGGGKHVVITATEGSDPVFVRVVIFAPAKVLDAIKISTGDGSAGGGSWDNKGDFKGTDASAGALGYWYYSAPIKDGESAEMDIELPSDFTYEADTFNVVVLHEYVPARPDGNGGLTADWDDTSLIVDATGEGTSNSDFGAGSGSTDAGTSDSNSDSGATDEGNGSDASGADDGAGTEGGGN